MSKRLRRILGVVLLGLLATWAALGVMGAPRQRALEVEATTSAGAPTSEGEVEGVPAGEGPARAPQPEQQLELHGSAGTDATRADGEPSVSAREAAPLPACTLGDSPAPLGEPPRWLTAVLDTQHMLPEDYAPTDLVELSTQLADVSRFAAAPGLKLRREAAKHLHALFVAAEAAGVHLEVISAYRSFDYQRQTFAYWVEKDGYDHAVRTSARPGHSEHQLGSVVDLRTRGDAAAWDLPDWGATPEGAWALENAWRFGFVLSYPAGKEDVTCYAYEPWHYRYVGPELAAAIRASGLSPREFLWSIAPTEGTFADDATP